MIVQQHELYYHFDFNVLIFFYRISSESREIVDDSEISEDPC